MSVYFIFNYVWGVIYRIGQVIFKCFFVANSCFVLNVCKVVLSLSHRVREREREGER